MIARDRIARRYAERLSGVLRGSDGATLDLFAVGHR